MREECKGRGKGLTDQALTCYQSDVSYTSNRSESRYLTATQIAKLHLEEPAKKKSSRSLGGLSDSIKLLT